MTITSQKLFESHFSTKNINDVIDLYLTPNSARGVDGTNYDRFIERKHEEVNLISSRALKGEYKFSPYRQKLIIKDAKSFPRQVSIPTIRDKIALRVLNNFLCERFPIARPQHSHQVISSVIKSIQKSIDTDRFIKLDIQSFYDKIDHEILMKNLQFRIRAVVPLNMIRSAISTPTGSKVADAHKNSLGVPQGLSISNILASIYLESIDQKYSPHLGLSYHRYVDDILCIASEIEANITSEAIINDLKRKKKLIIHPIGSGKSTITPISKETVYLGYRFCGKKISVKKNTEKKLLTSIMQIIHSTTSENLERSIWRINLRLSGCRLNGNNIGWMFYFSQINDKQLLSRIDAQIKRTMIKKFDVATYRECKRIIKSYHEVKYKYDHSNYFHNFDIYQRSEMLKLLNSLYPNRFSRLDKKSDADVRRIFNIFVSREVREMERDTLGNFS